MRKPPKATFLNPLRRFLSEESDDTDLEILAREYSKKPFDADRFRRELEGKLKRLNYRPDKATGNERTFYEIIENAGVLSSLLAPETLRDLHECLLMVEICKIDREREKNKMTIDDLSRAERESAVTQINRDLRYLETLRFRYGLPTNYFDNIIGRLNRLGVRHMVRLLKSHKYKTARSLLLSGGGDGKYQPRDEDVAAKKAIYLALGERLKASEGRNRFTELFLCQLAELIWAPPRVTCLSNGKTLYRAMRRSART